MIKFKYNNKDYIKLMYISGKTKDLLETLDSQGLDISVVYEDNEFNDFINCNKHIIDDIKCYLNDRFNCLLSYKDINKIYDIHKIKCLGIDNTYCIYINCEYYLVNDMYFINKYLKN